MSLDSSKRVFMLLLEKILYLLTADTTVVKNPVHFVRHGFIFQPFTLHKEPNLPSVGPTTLQ